MPRILRTALLTAILLALALPGGALALDVGGPGRDLELGKSAIAGGLSYTSFEVENADCSSRAFLSKVSFGVATGVTPYFRVGFADLSVPGADGTLGFAWGGGVLLRLMAPATPEGLTLLADLQGLRTESKASGTSLNATQLQGAILASGRTGPTTTYGGVALTSIDAEGPGAETKTNLLIGVDYFIDLSFFVTAEAHLFGEDSITVGVGYQF